MVKHKAGPSLKSHPLSWGVCLIQLFGGWCDSCRLYQHTSSLPPSSPSFSVLEEKEKCLWNSEGWQQGERELVESWRCPVISYPRGRDECPALTHPPTQDQNIAPDSSQYPPKPTCKMGRHQPGNIWPELCPCSCSLKSLLWCAPAVCAPRLTASPATADVKSQQCLPH